MLERALTGYATSQVCSSSRKIYQIQARTLGVSGMAMTKSDPPPQARNVILHRVPTSATLENYELQFASQYLADEVAARAAEDRLQELNEVLRY